MTNQPKPTETAATLARIEAKLDLVLERIKWAPRTEAADWYSSLYPKYSNPTDDKAQESTKR